MCLSRVCRVSVLYGSGQMRMPPNRVIAQAWQTDDRYISSRRVNALIVPQEKAAGRKVGSAAGPKVHLFLCAFYKRWRSLPIHQHYDLIFRFVPDATAIMPFACGSIKSGWIKTRDVSVSHSHLNQVQPYDQVVEYYFGSWLEDVATIHSNNSWHLNIWKNSGMYVTDPGVSILCFGLPFIDRCCLLFFWLLSLREQVRVHNFPYPLSFTRGFFRFSFYCVTPPAPMMLIHICITTYFRHVICALSRELTQLSAVSWADIRAHNTVFLVSAQLV